MEEFGSGEAHTGEQFRATNLDLGPSGLDPERPGQLDELLDEIRGHDELLGYDDAETVAYRIQLRDAGPAAGAAILESLSQGDGRATPDLLMYCATEANAAAIGDLLMARHVDYFPLVRTLEHIGTSGNVGQLLAAANDALEYLKGEDVDLDSYGASIEADVAIESLATLYAIRHRTVAEDDLDGLNAAIGFISERVAAYTTQDLEQLRADTMPNILRARRESYYTEVEQDEDLDDYDYLQEDDVTDSGYATGYEDYDIGGGYQDYDDTGDDAEADTDSDLDDDNRLGDYEDDYGDYVSDSGHPNVPGSLDDRIRDDTYTDDDDRTGVIRRLHGLGEMPMLDGKGIARRDRRMARIEYMEAGAPAAAPTVGIEIEVYARTVLPPDAENWTDAQKQAYMAVTNEEFLATQRAGIPRGKDGLWEFAHDPARHYRTLTEEVRALVDLELINPAHKRHPLHLTVGGVTSTGRHGREAYVLTRALEATGWATHGMRLLKPELTGKGCWTLKGHEGIMERSPGEMQLNTAHGIEIRTFQFQGLANLDRTLGSAYYLGAGLKAYQFGQPGNQQDQRLATEWADFSHLASLAFTNHGMEDPSMSSWEHKVSYPPLPHGVDVPPAWGPVHTLSHSWHTLAGLLTESLENPDSEGREFVTQMRDLVRTHRRAIHAILSQAA